MCYLIHRYRLINGLQMWTSARPRLSTCSVTDYNTCEAVILIHPPPVATREISNRIPLSLLSQYDQVRFFAQTTWRPSRFRYQKSSLRRVRLLPWLVFRCPSRPKSPARRRVVTAVISCDAPYGSTSETLVMVEERLLRLLVSTFGVCCLV